MELADMTIERLIRQNDIFILSITEHIVRKVPYRGKQNRWDVLRFLQKHTVDARAVVYSHESESGPIGVDIGSGETVTWG
jgi:hypothetical protein